MHQRCFRLWKLKCLNRQKTGLVYTKKLVFEGKWRKIHIHQRGFKVFVGDPFAQHWFLDLGLLTQGRFRKRAVLANVPSFRFWVPGNIHMFPRSGFCYRGTSVCTFVPVFGTGEHLPKPPFWKPPFKFGNPRAVAIEKTSHHFPTKSSAIIRAKKSGMARVRLADVNGPKWT